MRITVMNHVVSKNNSQMFFLSLLVTSLLYLALAIGLRSGSRKSIFETGAASSGSSAAENPGNAFSADTSSVDMRNVYRVEIKKGKTVWEIKAKDAQYYSGAPITHVQAPAVTVHRGDGSSFVITAKAARLYALGSALVSAELEGDVVLTMDGTTKVLADQAMYSAKDARVSIPGNVTVHGQGYQIDGIGLDLATEEQIVRLTRDVRSKFEQDAHIPSGIKNGPSGIKNGPSGIKNK